MQRPPPLSPRTRLRRGSLDKETARTSFWNGKKSTVHNSQPDSDKYHNVGCVSSAPPATFFPVPSAYFTPARCSCSRAPAESCYRGSIRIWIHRHHPLPWPVAQISQRKKATHTHVSRLSHFVIPPFPVAQHGVGRTFLRHQFLMGRERYRTHDPEGSQDEVSFSHISQLPSWHISEDSRPQV